MKIEWPRVWETVIGGVILAMVIGAWGLFSGALAKVSLSAYAAWTLQALREPVGVPLYVVVLAGLVAIYKAQPLARLLRHGSKVPPVAEQQLGGPPLPVFSAAAVFDEPAELALSADEEAVLRMIVAAGGTEVDEHSESHVDAGLSAIRFREAVQQLVSKDMLVWIPGRWATQMFPRMTLTARGRQWAIRQGLA